MKLNEIKVLFKDRLTNIKQIDSGGNATVYSVVKLKTGERVALKILDSSAKNFTEKRNRFIIETKKVMQIQNQYKNIIPIIEYGLPDDKNENVYWYTMPVAIPVEKYFCKIKDIMKVVNAVIELGSLLVNLHDCDIVHRDIKPSNIYYYNGKFCLADFGLVDYPDKDNLTKSNEQIGAKATIAPEMKRDAKNADGKKADVYSLAKTLWMLLTKSKFGFEGIYSPNSSLMSLKQYYKDKHLVELTKLLVDSTQDNPDLRPSMKKFVYRLKEYCIIYSDFKKSNLSEWKFVQESLFNNNIPSSSSWDTREDIIKVINLLGSMPSLNHMFIPSGGGLDFDFAELAAENGCIALHASNLVYIVKPLKLTAENIQKDFIWSYFRLELDKLEPTGKSVVEDNTEYLTEYLPGRYISWICGNYGYFDNDKPLPKDYRLVTRFLRGCFVLFSKASIYNNISGTYDGRHAKFNSNDFRIYIEQLRQDFIMMNHEDFMEKYDPDPFENSSYMPDTKTIQKRLNQEEKLVKLIKDYFTKKNFTRELQGFLENNNTDYSLHFSLAINIKKGSLSNNLYMYLRNDGRFLIDTSSAYERYKSKKAISEKYVFINFDCVRKFMEYIQHEVKNIAAKLSLSDELGIYYFDIQLYRNKLPKHMFTKKEIRNVLINGNDHKNNVLAINGDGYAKLIEEGNYYELYQYPVIHEGYSAFNNYVGKYSKLFHLDDEYIASLQGWLMHLENGGRYRMDYVHKNRDEMDLLKKIKKFYK